jgi:hypothetical protein
MVHRSSLEKNQLERTGRRIIPVLNGRGKHDHDKKAKTGSQNEFF